MSTYLGVLGEVVKSGDVELELLRFAKLSKTSSERNKSIAVSIVRLFQESSTHVVDLVLVESEKVVLIGTLNQMTDVAANAVERNMNRKFEGQYMPRTRQEGNRDTSDNE